MRHFEQSEEQEKAAIERSLSYRLRELIRTEELNKGTLIHDIYEFLRLWPDQPSSWLTPRRGGVTRVHTILGKEIIDVEYNGISILDIVKHRQKNLHQKMPRIIGITGKAGAGKDTVGKILVEITGASRAGRFVAIIDPPAGGDWFYSPYNIKKFAEPVKGIVAMLTGMDRDRLEEQAVKESKIGPEWGDMTYRELMQKIGTDAIRNQVHPDAWVNAAFSDFNRQQSRWIFTDVRFPNEAERIKEKGGVILRVERPGVSLASNHASETEMDSIVEDYTIDNSGSQDDLYWHVLSTVYLMAGNE